jgi:hypothetical protein
MKECGGVLEDLAAVVGRANVLTGAECTRHARDWMGKYQGSPLAVVRPGSVAEVAACVRLTAAAGVAVVPVGGNTGLVGGTMTDGRADDQPGADEPHPRGARDASAAGGGRGGRGPGPAA